jgi:hypothetical protein
MQSKLVEWTEEQVPPGNKNRAKIFEIAGYIMLALCAAMFLGMPSEVLTYSSMC